MRKTYLRYPGGKSKMADKLAALAPDFSEYRESMVGGGSMFLHFKRTRPDAKFWINDKYTNLYLFWIACRDSNSALVDALLKIKRETTRETAREKFIELKTTISIQDELTRAVYFYYLNKCSFSGLTESGTCSPQAWAQNFSEASIESLRELECILDGVKITNFDYSEVLTAPGDHVFIYADPPYMIGENNYLYGRDGSLHESFSHSIFADCAKASKHKIMVSYNEHPEIRAFYTGWDFNVIDFRYTMRLMEKNAKKKQELIIRNYE